MSHTYSQNIIHIVFSTKERHRTISKTIQPRLWAYTAGICQNLEIFVHAIGGMEDHIHLLLQIPPKLSLANAVMRIKANSSKWVDGLGRKFEWQQGYGAFSVSASNLETVKRYIRNQERHHRKMNFEEEFLALLRKHGVKFDPKYVFG
jgi:putative transposase